MDTNNNYEKAYCNSCNNNNAKPLNQKALLTRAVIFFSVAIGMYFFSVIELCLSNFTGFVWIAATGLIPIAYGMSNYFKYKTFKISACRCKKTSQQPFDNTSVADYNKLAFETSAI